MNDRGGDGDNDERDDEWVDECVRGESDG